MWTSVFQCVQLPYTCMSVLPIILAHLLRIFLRNTPKCRTGVLTAMAWLSRPEGMLMILILGLLLAVCPAGSSKRPLFRASDHRRMPETYFIHIRHKVPEEQVHQLVRRLERRSTANDSFRARVGSIITRAGYGISAKLSPNALNYVSV